MEEVTSNLIIAVIVIYPAYHEMEYSYSWSKSPVNTGEGAHQKPAAKIVNVQGNSESADDKRTIAINS